MTNNAPAMTTRRKLRFVAYYGDPSEFLSEERYSDKCFCPNCERELAGAAHSSNFCPFCGVAIDSKVTFAGDYEDNGPRSVHPLVQKEWQRKQDECAEKKRKEVEQPDPKVTGCSKCKGIIVIHAWDDEASRSKAQIVLSLACRIECPACGKLLHNCGSYFDAVSFQTKLTCSPSVKTAAVALSNPNPSDPYGLHVAGRRGIKPRVKRRMKEAP